MLGVTFVITSCDCFSRWNPIWSFHLILGLHGVRHSQELGNGVFALFNGDMEPFPTYMGNKNFAKPLFRFARVSLHLLRSFAKVLQLLGSWVGQHSISVNPVVLLRDRAQRVECSYTDALSQRYYKLAR